jgi:peptidoglycan/LPS O-acetylase OafA/YrhL
MPIMWALASGPRSILNRGFESNILVYLGGISYGLYVYHEMCYRVVSTCMRESSAELSLIASCGLAIVVAQLSMTLLEAPCLRLKARFGASRS